MSKAISSVIISGVKIYVHPGGRLGNQLYFAAAAERVRIHLKSLGIDSRIYWYATHDYLTEIQQVVDFKVDFYKKHRLLAILYRGKRPLSQRSRIEKLVFKVLWSRFPFRKYLLPDDDFNPSLFNSRKHKNVFIVNYHQNYLLSSVAISKWREPKNVSVSSEMLSLLKSIQELNPVAVTMRFGDFLNPDVANEQGNLSQEYFSKALSRFEINPSECARQIWIFSDDPEVGLQTLQNWGYSNLIKVRSFGLDHVSELLLLANFSDLIICNSTYSWWAGYLVSKNSRVIAPSPLTRNLQSNPAIDPRWERIPAGYPDYSPI